MTGGGARADSHHAGLQVGMVDWTFLSSTERVAGACHGDPPGTGESVASHSLVASGRYNHLGARSPVSQGRVSEVAMVSALLILAGLLSAAQSAPNRATAADRITLRDGSVVLGLVTSSASGPRASVEVLVRREWAEANLKDWAKKWDRSLEAGSRLAARQRHDRLTAWRRDRAPSVTADDRIIAWIERELKRLARPDPLWRTPLMPVHLARGDVKTMSRQPHANSRLLQLGWLCELRNVETMSPDALADALESRGFDIHGDTVPSLSGLLPLAPEGDMAWLARRAATELSIDPDLRFIRYQGMLLPDAQGGRPAAGLDLASALSAVTKLLDPEQGRADPLAAVLKRVADRGRVGAIVTTMEMPADFARVSVESTLWLRAGGDRWVPYGARSSSIRPDDLAPDAGKNLAGDPQVGTAFSLVEALGLGTVAPELKQRALRMGAATEKALGTVRSAVSQDLEGLMLPIFEGGKDSPEAGQANDKRPAPDKDHRGPSR